MLIKIREIEEQPEGLRSFAMPGAGLLLSPFAKILSGVLIAGMLASTGVTVYKSIQLKNIKIELLETQNKLIHESSELAKSHKVVDDQNKEIANIQIDAAENVALITKINDQLNNANKIQTKEIERLKTTTAPLTCAESKDWLKDNISVYGEQE
jgi:Tfp pilus assembly protein PilN